ncbi:MAG: triosephosphate isomerase [Proteobacteria bacterium]|nr:triosephosphate isomerase [Pseudomonadota bacterium]NBP14521.1 triosephosphate isomerase [bacterium]
MKLLVANWKMNLTVHQTLDWCQNYLELFKEIDHKLIVCPSYPALTAVSQLIKGTDIALCGQSCSEHRNGSYTGQVDAQSLAQVGCSYVLVGHSEERNAFNLTNEQVAQKALRVTQAGMIPIICIGEPEAIYQAGTTQEYLEEQLFEIKRTFNGAPAYIAYEPIWAIGTSKIPTNEELIKIVNNLKLFIQGCAFLYGGSVNPQTIKQLSRIKEFCGYLIGSASLDGNQLKKIIELC